MLSVSLKIDKIQYRAVIKLFVKEGLTPTEIHSKFIKVYGDSSPLFSTIKKWAAEFKRGRTGLEEDPRDGRTLHWEWMFVLMEGERQPSVGVILVRIYRVSEEECARLREGVPYVKVYRYNPKHLCPKLSGYGDNAQRKAWSSGGSTHCTCQLTILIDVCP